MRTVPIIKDNYYHVYNRGLGKQMLFYDQADYVRFQFLLLHFQSELVLPQTNRSVKHFLKYGTYKVTEDDLQKIIDRRFVEVINYCIMPNHFHIALFSLDDNGVSRYMHKLSNAYAKYFNTRYERTGHVFQGTYKAKLVTSDEQLTYLSAYIHRNPNELKLWKDQSLDYPWSSYQDHSINRWGKLLINDHIMRTFSSFKDYQEYVEASGVKSEFK